MTLKHLNPTQQVNPTKFLPLLKDESPYYDNLNRMAKNAYDYADKINNMFNYAGSVSRVLSTSLTPISLYTVVKLLNDETIITAANNTPVITERFGLVVAERDEEGYYLICTFNPNFIYPVNIILFDNSIVGEYVYIDTGNLGNVSNITVIPPVNGVVVGRVSSIHSIFFHGTSRDF